MGRNGDEQREVKSTSRCFPPTESAPVHSFHLNLLIIDVVAFVALYDAVGRVHLDPRGNVAIPAAPGAWTSSTGNDLAGMRGH